MSFGTIVTCFACMVQRLVSSMRLTKYASAASYRHIMVFPWKCRSYLPTSRAISWTSHEKESFLMRSLELFWNCQISQRATVPGRYFLVFLTLPAWRNFLLGGFASHGRWELPPDWLLPQSRWPSLHSHLGQLLGGNNDGDLPTSSSCLASSTASQPLPMSSPPPSQVRAFWLGIGGALGRGPPSFCDQFFSFLLWPEHPPLPSLLLGINFVLGILPNKQTDLVVHWKYCYKIQTTK